MSLRKSSPLLAASEHGDGRADNLPRPRSSAQSGNFMNEEKEARKAH
jgi:hypothetical protein